MVLPGAHMQAKVLHRRRGCHRVAPGRPEPLDGAAQCGLAGDALEAVDHIVGPQHAQPVQQRARVLEHDARLAAFGEQRRDELAHARIAVPEDGRIVVVAHARMLEHVLQVADECGRAQLGTAGRDQRLVHVQCHRAGAADAVEADAALRQKHRGIAHASDRALDQRLGTAQVGQVVDGLRQVGHGSDYLCRMNS
jgi:hypothetical protein